MRRRGMLVVMAGAIAAAACSLVFPFDGYGPGTGAGDAGAPDRVAVDAADAFVPGCPLIRAPGPPAADDPGGTETSITMAVDTLVLGLGKAQTPGLDLDGLCSCPDITPCVGEQRVCDREGGVDNGFDDLLAKFGAFGAPIEQDKVQAALDSGNTTVLILVRSYNGLPNDTSVEVGVLASLGMPTNDAGEPLPPRRDGTDEWTVDPGSVANGAPPYVPKGIATEAYVTNGVLVARGAFTISLGSGSPLEINLDEGYFVGRLSHDGTVWRVTDGRIGGRWPTSRMLVSFAVLEDPLAKGSFLCGDSGAYQAYKPQLCAAADIMAKQGNDLSDKKCDATSIGMGFGAVEAKAGALGAPRVLTGGCGPGWQDDCPR